ncbi:acetolactate decarboxylase [Psychroserpens sp. XS_ASV72]|uniref:acetolactate decarboxylase n=1 Tax=Psychroserpens sp. XS_ASV72 TaxID=3241293 RepID=UPI00351468A9
MKIRIIIILTFIFLYFNCKSNENHTETYPDVKVVSAMKNVMWKGELDGKIQLDTVSNKKGLYGLGPESFLAGELLINNGKSYVSKVTSDSTMIVTETFDTSAPFFVYANVNEWETMALPASIKNISDIESFIDQETKNFKRPFAFKLIGKVAEADIHIQNLPKGTKVSSPKEAHQGQTNYQLIDEDVEIIGFFSTEHQGVFTHHDSFLHMHLINSNATKMGHLDAVEIDNIVLYLPKE